MGLLRLRRRRLKISNYQLFPGVEGKGGIDREILAGINAIVGINGLGKTTLLNAMFRVLSGPSQLERSIEESVGGRPNTLKAWTDIDYFAARTRDEAAGAIIRAEVGSGDHLITVERSLRT